MLKIQILQFVFYYLFLDIKVYYLLEEEKNDIAVGILIVEVQVASCNEACGLHRFFYCFIVYLRNAAKKRLKRWMLNQ